MGDRLLEVYPFLIGWGATLGVKTLQNMHKKCPSAYSDATGVEVLTLANTQTTLKNQRKEQEEIS